LPSFLRTLKSNSYYHSIERDIYASLCPYEEGHSVNDLEMTNKIKLLQMEFWDTTPFPPFITRPFILSPAQGTVFIGELIDKHSYVSSCP
jgi:hypothetical protein